MTGFKFWRNCTYVTITYVTNKTNKKFGILSTKTRSSSKSPKIVLNRCFQRPYINDKLLQNEKRGVQADTISNVSSGNHFHHNFYLTLILLRLFQQHYCYNVTGQSQESEGSCKPARIKEVHSKLHSFQASLCTLTATHLTLIYVCTYIRLSVPLGCLIKQAGIIIHTILNMWETPGIEPVTSDLTSVYQISSSTN